MEDAYWNTTVSPIPGSILEETAWLKASLCLKQQVAVELKVYKYPHMCCAAIPPYQGYGKCMWIGLGVGRDVKSASEVINLRRNFQCWMHKQVQETAAS